MSRSYRRDISKKAPKWGVEEYNKRHRRINKIRIHVGEEPLESSVITNEANFKGYKKINSFSVIGRK